MSIQLYVDDLRDPKDFVPGDWHWAKTCTEAIRILSQQDVSVVSLDHDIAHTIPIAESVIVKPLACGETFASVAYYIAAMPPERRPGKVIIHTGSAVGAKDIENILGDKIDVISIRMAQPEEGIQ